MLAFHDAFQKEKDGGAEAQLQSAEVPPLTTSPIQF